MHEGVCRLCGIDRVKANPTARRKLPAYVCLHCDRPSRKAQQAPPKPDESAPAAE